MKFWALPSWEKEVFLVGFGLLFHPVCGLADTSIPGPSVSATPHLSPTCSRCSEIHNLNESEKNALVQVQKDLDQHKREVTLIPKEEVTKRTRMTTAIFILTAKKETFENRIKARTIESEKLVCQRCLGGPVEPSKPIKNLKRLGKPIDR